MLNEDRSCSCVPVISRLLMLWYAEPTWLFTFTLRAWRTHTNTQPRGHTITATYVFPVCVCPCLQCVHCSSSESDGCHQCWGQPHLGTSCCHQTLTVDEEVDEGEGVQSLHAYHRLWFVVQRNSMALLLTAPVGQGAWQLFLVKSLEVIFV